MKFFVDTANLDEIRELNDLGVLDGVTTNPSLMAKVGITGRQNVLNHYLAICEMVEGDISAEVIATDFEGMMREGMELANLHDNIVVKVPMTRDGIKAINAFSEQGIRTNCTLVFTVGQALLAAKAGADYVSPFVGRLDDVSTNGLALIQDIVTVFNNYDMFTEVLAASIRHPVHIVECAKMGADVVTCPASSIDKLFNHPLTDIGLAQFLADYKKVE
ncbi:MAG: fructose-6-phosphate aldolase [Bacteroidetes bacterium]|jgi:transaldolase|nr:fructose-6-phosphate aldolase [Bacteroidota bacterium]